MRLSIIDSFKSSVEELKNEIIFLNKELGVAYELKDKVLVDSNKLIQSIENEFKNLHQILELKQRVLIDQIKEIQNENENEYEYKKSIVNNKIQLILNSLDKFNDNKLNKEDIKLFNEQIDEANKVLPPFKNIIQPYKHTELNKNEILDISNQNIGVKLENMINENYKINCIRKIHIYYNDYSIVLDNNELPKSIIDNSLNNTYFISPEYGMPSIIPSCKGLTCVKEIPNFGNIKLETLVLRDIEKPLVVGSIPDCVKTLLLYGYEHPITKGVIPKSVINLKLNVQHPLNSESIPSSVDYLLLNNCTKSKNSKYIIPNEVSSVAIYHSSHTPFDLGPIPKSVKIVSFHDGFKTNLSQVKLPRSLESLSLLNIEQPLNIGSIPKTIKRLYLKDGFKHQLTPGIIHNGIIKLEVHDISQPLQVGSIPSSVVKLFIHSGFKHPLGEGIIPDGVKELFISSNHIQLKDIAFPPSIKQLHILNDKIKLDYSVINNTNINRLWLCENLCQDTTNIQMVKTSIAIRQTFNIGINTTNKYTSK